LKSAREAVDKMVTAAAERLRNVPQMETTRRELLANAVEFYQTVIDQHSLDPEVRFESALAYQKYGGVEKSLGDVKKGQEATRQSIEVLEQLAKEYPREGKYRHMLAHSYSYLGHDLNYDSRIAEAGQAYQRAYEIAQKLVDDFPNNAEYHGWLLGRRHNVANNLFARGRLADAEALHRENLAIRLQSTLAPKGLFSIGIGGLGVVTTWLPCRQPGQAYVYRTCSTT
jgi:tetratricopeptide (TPR) repeat protein